MHTLADDPFDESSLLRVALDFIAQRCETDVIGERIHLHVTLTPNEMERLACFGAALDELEPDDCI